MKILLLEDDLLLNEIILEHLEEQNYEVTSAFDSSEAIEHIYSSKFDLFLFDVNVPNLNGFELLKELRTNNIKTPTIFITSLHMMEDMKKGFDSGCDDYIKKPFELQELDLRINNIKRIYHIEESNLIEISSNISLDAQNLFIQIDDKKEHISKKDCEVLKYLLKNSNKHVSVEELSTNVWAFEETPNASTIRTYIKNLRKVLGEDKIENIRGVGYRFNK